MRLRALVVKEFYQIIRDPSTILISVVLPLILLFLYGTCVSLDLDHLRIGVVLEDTAPDAISLLEGFKGSPYFDAKIVRDRRELQDEMTRGGIRGFVVIPSYFSTVQPQQIQAIGDGSEPNTANFFQSYTQGVFSNWLLSQYPQVGGVVRLEPRIWYNESAESRNFLLPGSLAVIMTLIGTLLTALVVAREWERGTLEALLATSVTRGELILGKLIPYFVLGLLSMAICLFVTTLIYSVPFRGSLFALFVVSSVFLLGALGLGLMISTVCKNQILAYQISLVAGFLPAYILSGFLFEIASMPTWVQLLSTVMPARYFVQALQTVFLVGDIWPLFLSGMVCMFLFALVCFRIIIKKTVKRLDG